MSSTVFNHEHFNELSEDPYYRFIQSSKKVGYAIISESDNENAEITQFSLNNITKNAIRPLCNITKLNKFGTDYYQARTPNNTLMSGKRFVPISFEKDNSIYNAKIVCFSPTKKKDFVGSTEEIQIRKDKPNSKICDRIKGGAFLEVNPEDTIARSDQNRSKSQNQVMGKSACDEFTEYQDMYEDRLTADANKFLIDAAEAPLRNLFYGQKRPEWLHAYAHSLTPLSLDPQISENLGAAPKWSNTAMMISERAARWFAQNHPDSSVKIKPSFHMIKDFEIVRKIKYELSISKGSARLRFLQTIMPFARYPLYNKATDIAGITFIASALIEMRRPSHISSLVIQQQNQTQKQDNLAKKIEKPEVHNINKKRKRKQIKTMEAPVKRDALFFLNKLNNKSNNRSIKDSRYSSER